MYAHPHALHRQDEVGTPYRIIADDGSLETGIISLQDRDTTASVSDVEVCIQLCERYTLYQEDMNGQDVLLTLQRMMFGVHVT